LLVVAVVGGLLLVAVAEVLEALELIFQHALELQYAFKVIQ
jgi:hypothetical protein